jgi:lipoprotein-anchoring transpeptidase ErfK/SrfK
VAGAAERAAVECDGGRDHGRAFADGRRSKGGDAQIAIHRTNAPSSIGDEMSNGCLRIAPDALRALAAAITLGTPVTIKA